ncbi:MAG: hypothetical protein DI551_04560 [Micavibrio aeruginosavorus]|uniref:Copper chaperone PCu(A)C n=1 Tax=Micavibrio aeruginosavorus TaxID=349221 RepID=A0A2W5N2X1_9BACT|nr:MAG: hypothetical protein DI551_04560 [Micavibrio aeruginosavorus]
MKRSYYLFPLMAMTALSLTLAACDDNKAEDTATTETTTTVAETTVAPAATTETTPAAVASVQAEGATSFATAPGATTGAVFLTLHNPGTAADRLNGLTTTVSSSAELHESYTDEQGVMQMRKVDAIEIPAGQQVSLKADGYHIMLIGLSEPLTAGIPFNVTLDFESAPDVTIPVTVTSPVGSAAPEATPMDHEGMDHGAMVAPSEEVTPEPTTTDGTVVAPEAETTEPVSPTGATTPDMAPTSSAPDASTTTPSATGE